MWYTSGPVSGIGSKIGCATSTDGIAWTKDANNPILSVGSSGVWDAGGVENQCVVQSQGGYLLYYDGYGPTKTSLNYIGVAQSVATTSQTATQIYTTSTPSLQLPQPPQSTGSQSTNNTPQLALALAVIAAVVLGALFLYKRRGKQPETTEAKKVDSATKKTASGKNFCIECGSELPLKSKFCNNCGTKQP
jgi:ribosomal protein L40E